MAVKTAAPGVSVSPVLSGANYALVKNRTEQAHRYTVSSSVEGVDQSDLYLVIAPSDLSAWTSKLQRQLARLHKSNPDRFNALLVADLPTLSGYAWYVLAIKPGQSRYALADPDQWSHAEVLYHFRKR